MLRRSASAQEGLVDELEILQEIYEGAGLRIIRGADAGAAAAAGTVSLFGFSSRCGGGARVLLIAARCASTNTPRVAAWLPNPHQPAPLHVSLC